MGFGATEKSGAKNSAFSKFKPRYCSLVSKGKVWIKVCNMKSPSGFVAQIKIQRLDFSGLPGLHSL